MKDGDKGFLIGLALGTALSVASFGIAVSHSASHWQAEVIKRGHAYYHPVTREFTWREGSERESVTPATGENQ